MKKTKNIFDLVANLINCILMIILIFIVLFGILLIIQNIFKVSDKNSVLNYKTFIITSESMKPELYVGDIIFIKEDEKYEKGDIVTYKDRTKGYVTHRIIGNVEENNGKNFITKGDENKDSDTEPVNINQIVGKVVGKISFIRKTFKFITNKFVIVFFIIFYISYFIYNRNEKNRVK